MKIRSAYWAFRLAASLLAVFTVGTAQATENILVMGGTTTKTTSAATAVPSLAVRDALANQLGDAGFRVYDETAITMDNFQQGRCRREDAELIDIARSIRQPTIDVVVRFRIYAATKDTTATTSIALMKYAPPPPATPTARAFLQPGSAAV